MINRVLNSFVATFKDVRAVSDAKIIIDGLTVLCGKNSSGKTTISRTIQDVIEALLYLKMHIRHYILTDLYYDVRRQISNILSSIGVDVDKEQYLRAPHINIVDLSREIAANHIDGLLTLLGRVYASQQWLEKQRSVSFKDFSRYIVMPEPIASYAELEEKIITRVRKAKSDLDAVDAAQLSKDVFSNQAHIMSRYLWDGHVEVEELERKIISYTNGDVECSDRVNSISNVVYIESPLVSGLSFDDDGSFKITNNLVSVKGGIKTSTASSGDTISRFIKEVLEGEIKPDVEITGRKMWSFSRQDLDDTVESFDLADCATGIKGISIIASLYEQKCLTDKTLLIIDEPEAHLHPEWVVAYARIIVLLVKRLGLRILLASHSPDMINALQAFSSSANISDWTHFYQSIPSKRVKSKFKYEFIDKKVSVSDIFDSFNNVYDLIKKYSIAFRAED